MKDLIIKSGNNILKLNFLKWDTDFFKTDSFLVDMDVSRVKNRTRSFKEEVLEVLPPSFITAKVSLTQERDFIDFLLDLGFRYIDTEVILEQTGNSALDDFSVPALESSEINFYKAERIPGDAYLLAKEFGMSRFHSDERIPKNKADMVWDKYVKNYKLSHTNHLFCAQIGKKTAGLIFVKQYLLDGKKTSNLFLVSVKKEYRNRRIGSHLINFVIDWCKEESERIIVETHPRNLNAFNFYLKNGFLKLCETRLILHRWSV